MEFLSLSRRRPSWRNVPCGEERVETAVFAGYGFLKNKNLKSNDVFALYEQELAQSVSVRSSVWAVTGSIPRCDLKSVFRLLSFQCSFRKL